MTVASTTHLALLDNVIERFELLLERDVVFPRILLQKTRIG